MVNLDLTAAQLRKRGSLKWTQHPADVLGAWVAEMDYGLASPVAEALHDAIDRGDTGYFYPALVRSAGEAASSFWADNFTWSVDPDRVMPVPDVVEGIRRVIEQLTEPETAVILHTPVYYPFFSMVERAHRNLVEVPSAVDEEGRHRLDLERIDAAFAGGAGCLVLCNPWNPTGRSFTAPELADVIDIASSHGGRVISDEIHAPLTYPGSVHIPAASMDPETVITVTSASKAWNLPGLKCGQVVLTNEADCKTWIDYFSPEKVGVSTFGLIANAAAYAQGHPWLEEVMAILESNRQLLGELIQTRLPEMVFRPPEATYLAWLDFTPFAMTEPASFLLNRARVALTDGAPFGVGGKGHARLNFATTPSILEEIVHRIATALR